MIEKPDKFSDWHGIAEPMTDEELIADRKKWWTNDYQSIDDVPFTEVQKKVVLEYLAHQLMKVLEGVTGDNWGGKSYDPLFIEGNTAHSYAFDLWDGGRHHEFESLHQLQEAMVAEIVERLKEK